MLGKHNSIEKELSYYYAINFNANLIQSNTYGHARLISTGLAMSEYSVHNNMREMTH